jgi:23S rRNA (uracil1939-C5)-methyltransferase
LFLAIEKLVYGGDGLARLPADSNGRGKAVFVPFVLAGEAVEASITEQKAGFVRAQAGTVVEASPYRVPPACAYFGRCGGCHYQHASHRHQLEIKKEILRESLRRTAKMELPVEIEVHASPQWHYRNRSRVQVQTRPKFVAGYFKPASHDLLAVEECPISSPLVNRGLGALWQSGRDGRVPAGVAEVEFFANADDTELLVEVSCNAEARRAPVRQWAEDFVASMPAIKGLAVFRKTSSGNLHSFEKWLTVGADHLMYQTQRSAYRVSAGSFFQTNRHLTDELVRIVTAGASGELAFDLYAGVGLFSTALAGDIRHVFSVESSQTSSADLAYNRVSNGEAVQATTEQFLAGLEDKKGRSTRLASTVGNPDLIVVDPPRSGLGERVTRSLVRLNSPRLVYVSCDPVTLARDLAPLSAAGYRVEQMHLVDLFPQTYHLETVVHLAR